MIELLELLIQQIKKDLRHEYYHRTVKKAVLYKQLSSGEDSYKLLKQFVRREDDQLFKQRVQLTQEIHSSIVKNLSDINFKIPRSPGITRIYQYKDADEKKQDELTSILRGFNGDWSWNDYLNNRIFELNDTDPNAWIVIESEQTDGTKRLQPYPFEVSSEEAINFEFDNNILQWLLVRNDIKYIEGGNEKDGYKFTLYGKDGFIKFTQVGKDAIPGVVDKEDELIPTEEGIFIYIKNNVYQVSDGKYKTGKRVPAFCVGYNRDKATNGKSYVPSWNAAIPFLLKSVKTVSELDLTTALHAFPQKLAYLPMCEKCKGEKTIWYEEETETGTGSYITCDSCNGSGKEVATSAQDMIELALPKTANPDELIDLTRLVVYVNSVPIDLIKWQNEYIDSLIVKCKETVFNKGVFNKEDTNKTATGVQANIENSYDSLFNLAQHYVRTWSFGISIIATLTDLLKDLAIITNVSKDLKLKTKNDYLNDLQLASDAGASAQVLNNIEHEIVRVDFEDNPLMYNMFITKDFFFPFSGKDDNEVKNIVSILPITDRSKVLWIYYGIIFNEIELELGKREFYMDMNRKEQYKIIQKKVDEKVALLEVQQPKLEIPIEETK